MPYFPIESGKQHLKAKNYEAAIRDFTEAIHKYAICPYLLCFRGMAYKGIGETEKAIQDFQMALRCYPGFTLAKKELDSLNAKHRLPTTELFIASHSKPFASFARNVSVLQVAITDASGSSRSGRY